MKKTTRKRSQGRIPVPPTDTDLPLVHASEDIARWLQIYWQKLRIPVSQAYYLAVTDSRKEFARWTGSAPQLIRARLLLLSSSHVFFGQQCGADRL